MDLTGCWFNPAIDGSGLVIDDAPETRVVYWYGYLDDLPEAGTGQMWFIGQPRGDNRDELVFYRPEGSWMGATYKLGQPVAFGELSRDGDLLVLEYRLQRIGRCEPVMPGPYPPECRRNTWALERLTRRG